MANTIFLAHLACPDYSFHFEMSSNFLIIPLLIHLQQQHQHIQKKLFHFDDIKHHLLSALKLLRFLLPNIQIVSARGEGCASL